MRYRVFGLAVVIMMAALATGVWAKAVTIEEEDLAVLVGQAGTHFHAASERFMADYLPAAADEIRIGAAIMKLEYARATDEGKKILEVSINELNELADKVELNMVDDPAELDKAFARANYALANHRHLKAEEYYAKGENGKAAVELNAAAGNVERGFGWAGQKMEDGAVATIRGARLLTGKAIQAPGWVVSKTGRILAAVGRGVGGAIGSVGRGAAGATEAVGEATADVGKGAGKVVKGVGEGAGTVAEGVGKATGDVVTTVGEETKTGAVVGEAGKVVDAVGKGTSDVVGGVAGGAGTVVEATGAGAGTVVKGLGKGTGEAVEAVGKGVAWVPEQVGNSIDNIGKLIQKLGKAVEPDKK